MDRTNGLKNRLPVRHAIGAGLLDNGGQDWVGLFQVVKRFSHGTLFGSQTSYIVSMKSLTMLGVSSAVLLGSFAGAVVLLAQDEPIRVDVNLVSILASVRGKSGALISNTKDDFKIYEDGKEQPIKNFTRETDLPLTIGLLVDTSASQERLVDTEQRAASQFFSKVLRPKDQAFLIQFGAEAELLQDLTNSARSLQQGLNHLRLSVPVGGLHPGPVPTMQNQAGTILYDAVYVAVNDEMKHEVGRKALVLITDGVDTGSKITRDKAIEAAQKGDAIIYSIDYQDRAAYGGGFGNISFGGGGEGGRAGCHRRPVARCSAWIAAIHSMTSSARSRTRCGRSTPSPISRRIPSGMVRITRSTSSSIIRITKPQARKGYYAIEPEN